MLERERPLRARAVEGRERPASGDAQYASTNGDAIELESVGDRRVPAAHGWRRAPLRGGGAGVERDELEQAVHGVADLGRREPAAAASTPAGRARGGSPSTRSA